MTAPLRPAPAPTSAPETETDLAAPPRPALAPEPEPAPEDGPPAPVAPPLIEPAIDPADQRRYFRHLYWDIAWYGILAGSGAAFISVYLTRLGAGALAIGLLNAGPALVGLLFTLPAGRLLGSRPIGRAVLNAAILQRVGYVLWALLPLAFPPLLQIPLYLLLILVMSIPGTTLAIGFNALYAAAVPPTERGRIAGIRNAVLAVVYVFTTLLSGWLLSNLPLETGYTIVFALGAVGAVGSTYHLWHLRRLTGREGVDPSTVRAPLGDMASPGSMRSGSYGVRSSVALRVFARGKAILRPEILATSYGWIVGALFIFHFAQYLPVALFPLMWVNELNFTDQQIGIGTAVFHVWVLLGSLQLARLTDRKGNLWMMVIGVFGLSLYPLIVSFADGFALFVVASAVGGAAWSLMGGALGNYLLEVAPRHDRPAYLAWYNIALNAGILIGSLAGPALASAMTIRLGLVVAFAARVAAALAIWAAGRRNVRRET